MYFEKLELSFALTPYFMNYQSELLRKKHQYNSFSLSQFLRPSSPLEWYDITFLYKYISIFCCYYSKGYSITPLTSLFYIITLFWVSDIFHPAASLSGTTSSPPDYTRQTGSVASGAGGQSSGGWGRGSWFVSYAGDTRGCCPPTHRYGNPSDTSAPACCQATSCALT